jgi:hypothetical protein
VPGTKYYILFQYLLRQEIGDKSEYRFNKNKVKKNAERGEIGTLG